MSRSGKPNRPQGPYEVGYCRPPAATRYKPGRSGNPKGSRKAPKSVAVLLQEALNRKVTIREKDHARRVTVQEVIIQGLVNSAARQDPKSLRVLLSLMERYQHSTEPTVDPAHFLPEDRQIIENFLAQRVADVRGPTGNDVSQGGKHSPSEEGDAYEDGETR